MMDGAIFGDIGGDIRDRAFMTDWYVRRTQEVRDSLPRERLLDFHPKMGWQPLCEFLGAPVPDLPFPRVNSRDEFDEAKDERGGQPPDPETMERLARDYIDGLKAKAFA